MNPASHARGDATADPPFLYTNDDTNVGHNRESITGALRWVKVVGILVAVVVLLIVVMMLIGGGGHGPSRHASTGGDTGNTPPASVTEAATDDHDAPPAQAISSF